MDSIEMVFSEDQVADVFRDWLDRKAWGIMETHEVDRVSMSYSNVQVILKKRAEEEKGEDHE